MRALSCYPWRNRRDQALTIRISSIFDFSFALGFLSMGLWSMYRLALCLRYLRTTALPEERSVLISAVFYWLGSGLFFPIFGLNQIFWLLQRGSG